SLDDARIGGLGLAFMRKVMNSMSYSSDGDGNTLVLIKRKSTHET
ncbi:MAG: ATP-binding protein, partial [Chloroflexi bacterium]|nr:ATP-binding protein [Chloroflexota bacterium]